MSQTFVETTKRTGKEKMAIVTQNVLVSEYFKSVLGLYPYDISRDKDGHIIVLTHEKEDIDAFTLGINDETKQISPFHVGKISLDNHNYDRFGEIDLIGIHPAFMSKGLGTILLQSAENFFKTSGKNEIRLDALHHYEDISREQKTLQEVLSTMSREDAEAYITRNFCDINIYLYSTMGYVKLGDGTRYATVMKKNNLQQLSIAYGLTRPLTVSQSKKQYPISLAFEDVIYTAHYGTQKNLFTNTFNAFQSENFSPFIFNATEKDLTNFHEVAIKIKPESIYSDRLFHYERYIPFYSTKYSDLSKLAESVSSLQKLDKKIITQFDELYKKCYNALITIQNDEPGMQ